MDVEILKQQFHSVRKHLSDLEPVVSQLENVDPYHIIYVHFPENPGYVGMMSNQKPKLKFNNKIPYIEINFVANESWDIVKDGSRYKFEEKNGPQSLNSVAKIVKREGNINNKLGTYNLSLDQIKRLKQ